MRIIEYRLDGRNKLYDFNTLRNILKIDRSKLQRNLKSISGTDFVKYKNQFLYKEIVLFLLLEKQLIEKLDKIEN